MNEYVITTDGGADLPESYLEKNGIGCRYLSYNMDGKAYNYPDFLPVKEFYSRVRKGSLPTTAQVNPEQSRSLFEPYLKEGKDVLHIAFSSGLSGTCASAKIAADELKELYPERRVLVVDSLAASLGQGLLVHYAVQLKKEGKSLDEVYTWAEEHKLNVVHMFTVDNLFHLHRGGRVSKATAIVGSMLNIKPVLHVDNEGHLIAIGKVRGRKKSILELAAHMEQKLGSYADKCDTIFISHGDCEEEAKFLADHIRKKHNLKTVLINYVGSVIGAHSGPGTLALFFLGDER